jgi:lipoate-protein ligase A
MPLKITDRGVAEALRHMEWDKALLDQFATGADEAALCFYEWQHLSITHGYFIDPSKYIDVQAAKKHGIDIARRPTGGGLLFHMNDFVFTVAIPSAHPRFYSQVLENYRWINEAVAHGLGSADMLEPATVPQNTYASFCMASPTVYDLVVEGKKIGGSAQRKTKYGYIHQASLFLRQPPWHIIEEVVFDKEAVRAMRNSSSFLDSFSKKQIQDILIQELSASASVT